MVTGFALASAFVLIGCIVEAVYSADGLKCEIILFTLLWTYSHANWPVFHSHDADANDFDRKVSMAAAIIFGSLSLFIAIVGFNIHRCAEISYSAVFWILNSSSTFVHNSKLSALVVSVSRRSRVCVVLCYYLCCHPHISSHLTDDGYLEADSDVLCCVSDSNSVGRNTRRRSQSCTGLRFDFANATLSNEWNEVYTSIQTDR